MLAEIGLNSSTKCVLGKDLNEVRNCVIVARVGYRVYVLCHEEHSERWRTRLAEVAVDEEIAPSVPVGRCKLQERREERWHEQRLGRVDHVKEEIVSSFKNQVVGVATW
jgi:hypothetical protein